MKGLREKLSQTCEALMNGQSLNQHTGRQPRVETQQYLAGNLKTGYRKSFALTDRDAGRYRYRINRLVIAGENPGCSVNEAATVCPRDGCGSRIGNSRRRSDHRG